MVTAPSYTLNIAWFQPPADRTYYEYSLAYLFTRTHYKLYGKYNKNVNWMDPIYDWLDIQTIEQAVDRLKDADVICFSNYVWNYSVNDRAAEYVKQKYPHIKTIVGGPQLEYSNPDFDNRYKMFDYHCEPTMSAELYLEDWINGYFEDNKQPIHSKIAYERKSTVRKSFNYPYVSVYEDNIEFIRQAKQYFDSKNIMSRIGYETTRGCPFKCTFCEWGGGTGEKLKKKDTQHIKKDLDVIASLGFKEIDLIDSNLGAFKERDWQLLEMIHERGLRIMVLSLLKTKDLERKKTIIDNLMDRGYRANLSVQTFSKEALTNAQRPDLDLEQQFELVYHIRQRVVDMYGEQFFEKSAEEIKEIASVEFIMGMPGSNKNDFYKEYLMMEMLGSWLDGRFEYSYLPFTIASSDEDKLKFDVHLVPVYTESIFGTRNYFETISHCYSYTKDDMYEMFLMNLAGNYLRKNFYDFVKEDINIVDFMRACYPALQNCHGFTFIHEQIVNFFDPTTASDFFNLEGIHGDVKHKRLVVEEWLEVNRTLILSQLLSLTHQTQSESANNSFALV